MKFKKRQKRQQIGLRVNPAEYEYMSQKSKQHKISISEVARTLIQYAIYEDTKVAEPPEAENNTVC